MIKKTYIIKLESKNLENFDNNLDLALNDIRYMHQRHLENFDFEILGLWDGYAINDIFNQTINAFLHDIIQDNNLLNSVYKSKDFSACVKLFIKNIFDYIHNQKTFNEDLYEMDVFTYTEDGEQFYITVYIPKTMISDSKFENFLNLGPDYLLGNFNTADIFNYIAAPLYLNLAHNNLLNNEKLRNLSNYKIGLH